MLASLAFLQSFFVRQRQREAGRAVPALKDAGQAEQRQLEAWLFDRDSR